MQATKYRDYSQKEDQEIHSLLHEMDNLRKSEVDSERKREKANLDMAFLQSKWRSKVSTRAQGRGRKVMRRLQERVQTKKLEEMSRELQRIREAWSSEKQRVRLSGLLPLCCAHLNFRMIGVASAEEAVPD